MGSIATGLVGFAKNEHDVIHQRVIHVNLPS